MVCLTTGHRYRSEKAGPATLADGSFRVSRAASLRERSWSVGDRMPLAAETRRSATTARVLVAFFFIIIININILSDAHRASRMMKVIIPEEDTAEAQRCGRGLLYLISPHTRTHTHTNTHAHKQWRLRCAVSSLMTSPPLLLLVLL